MELDTKKLYRFRTFDEEGYSIKSLINDELYLPSPIKFNDPYDMLINRSKLTIRKYFENNSNFKELIKKYLFKYNKLDSFENLLLKDDYDKYYLDTLGDAILGCSMCIKNHFAVGCFSKRVDKEIMWAHYANYAKGFCLEYDVKDLEQQIKLLLDNYKMNNIKERFGLFEIKYSDEHSGANEILKHYLPIYLKNYINENYVADFSFVDFQKEYEELISSKHKDWSYEEEVRLVLPLLDLKNDNIKLSSIKPKAIYLGEFISDENKYLCIGIAKEKNIPIYRMQSKFTKNDVKLISYELNFK